MAVGDLHSRRRPWLSRGRRSLRPGHAQGRRGRFGEIVSPKKLERLKGKIEKRGVWAVFFAALLPPPFPFTAVIAAASALQVERRGMLTAVFVGRMVRFTAESLLALYFGRRLLHYLRSEYVEYFVYGLIAVAVVGAFLTVRKLMRARPRRRLSRRNAD